jgi:hypothetical protein
MLDILRGCWCTVIDVRSTKICLKNFHIFSFQQPFQSQDIDFQLFVKNSGFTLHEVAILFKILRG